jgi:small subunit ribosomal protein S17
MKKNEKKLLGKFVNVSGKNTIRVNVEFLKIHKKYKKYIKQSKNYLVHCNDVDVFKLGDKVLIKSTRPISKTKSFVFVQKVEEVKQ